MSCGGHHVAATPVPASGTVATTTLDRVWVVGNSGPPASDTTVVFSLAAGRTIVLRQPDADHAIFATIAFPPQGDSARTGDSTRIAIHSEAGVYQFTLSGSGDIPPNGTAAFSYPIHFQTPAGAAAKHPNPVLLELQVTPALIGTDGKVDILAATRPAADMLQFGLRGSGTYALVFAK